MPPIGDCEVGLTEAYLGLSWLQRGSARVATQTELRRIDARQGKRDMTQGRKEVAAFLVPAGKASSPAPLANMSPRGQRRACEL